MTRITGPNCVIMCNLKNTRTRTFCTRRHLCRQGVVLAGTQQLRSQGTVPVHALCTEGVSRPEERERANGDGNGVGSGNRSGSGTSVGAMKGARTG